MNNNNNNPSVPDFDSLPYGGSNDFPVKPVADVPSIDQQQQQFQPQPQLQPQPQPQFVSQGQVMPVQIVQVPVQQPLILNPQTSGVNVAKSGYKRVYSDPKWFGLGLAIQFIVILCVIGFDVYLIIRDVTYGATWYHWVVVGCYAIGSVITILSIVIGCLCSYKKDKNKGTNLKSTKYCIGKVTCCWWFGFNFLGFSLMIAVFFNLSFVLVFSIIGSWGTTVNSMFQMYWWSEMFPLVINILLVCVCFIPCCCCGIRVLGF